MQHRSNTTDLPFNIAFFEYRKPIVTAETKLPGYAKVAPLLAKNGYTLTVPLRRAPFDQEANNQKRVANGKEPLRIIEGKEPAVGLMNWPSASPEKRIDQWLREYPNAGVGLQTTETFLAFDIDSYDRDASQSIMNVIHDLWGDAGTFIIRIGQSPKFLIPFRANEPISGEKVVFATEDEDAPAQKLEIDLRGAGGSQFVVSAHHYRTGRCYEYGTKATFANTPIDDLPTLTPDSLEEFWERVSFELSGRGYIQGVSKKTATVQHSIEPVDPDDFMHGLPPWVARNFRGADMTRDEVVALYAGVDPSELFYDERDGFFDVCCEIFSVFPGKDGIDIISEISNPAPDKHRKSDARIRAKAQSIWDSLKDRTYHGKPRTISSRILINEQRAEAERTKKRVEAERSHVAEKSAKSDQLSTKYNDRLSKVIDIADETAKIDALKSLGEKIGNDLRISDFDRDRLVSALHKATPKTADIGKMAWRQLCALSKEQRKQVKQSEAEALAAVEQDDNETTITIERRLFDHFLSKLKPIKAEGGAFYVRQDGRDGKFTITPLRSTAFTNRVIEVGNFISPKTVTTRTHAANVQDSLEARYSTMDLPETELHMRQAQRGVVGADDLELFWATGGAGDPVIKMTADGWSWLPEVDNMLFRTTDDTAVFEKPKRVKSKDIKLLWKYARIEKNDRCTFLGHLATSFLTSAEQPLMVLASLKGGTGKSTASTIVTRLLDPKVGKLRDGLSTAPKTARGLPKVLSRSRIVALDDVTRKTLDENIQRELGSYVSGIGAKNDKLFDKDGDGVVSLATAGMTIMTTNDPDILTVPTTAQRAVVYSFSQLADKGKLSVSEFDTNFEADIDRIRGALASLLCEVIAELPTIKHRAGHRISELVMMTNAVHKVLGVDGSFSANQDTISDAALPGRIADSLILNDLCGVAGGIKGCSGRVSLSAVMKKLPSDKSNAQWTGLQRDPDYPTTVGELRKLLKDDDFISLADASGLTIRLEKLSKDDRFFVVFEAHNADRFGRNYGHYYDMPMSVCDASDFDDLDEFDDI